MINAGAFIGQFMTAQLRDSVQCFGDDCYLLPYLILVGLMATSTAVFAAGEYADGGAEEGGEKRLKTRRRRKIEGKKRRRKRWGDLTGK